MADPIKCGHIYVFSDFDFTYNCDLCTNVYRTSEEFNLHIIRVHILQLPDVNHEDCCSGDSDTEDFFSCVSFIVSGDQPKAVEEISTHLHDVASTQSAAEILLPKERNPGHQESILTGQTEQSTNKADEISKPTVIKVERRSNRLRQETANILDDKNHAKVSDASNFRRPKSITSEASALSEKPRSDAPKKRKLSLECNVCGKIFSTKWDHNRHGQLHTGKRPHQCQTCPKTFGRRDNLNTHVKQVHTKDLRHRCSVCEKSFVDKFRLDIHNRQKHLDASDPRRFFLCKFCDGKFDTIDKLRYHKSRMHRQNSATFTCAYCQLVFNHRSYIIQHLQIHAGTKNFECKHCNKKFAQQHGKYQHESKCASK